MKNIYQKLKDWYRGEYIPLSFQEIIDSVKQSRKYLENREQNMPDRFNPPLIARIINPVWHFWLRHWKWIIGTLIALGALIIMLFDHISKHKP